MRDRGQGRQETSKEEMGPEHGGSLSNNDCDADL